jgi:hypothetical protein
LSSLLQAGSAVSKETEDKITAALPDKATVQPAKPRKLLVYTAALGFYHGSIPVAAKAVELMGKKTGAYEATVTDDPQCFSPENLKQYDAVFLVSTTGDMLLGGELPALNSLGDTLNKTYRHIPPQKLQEMRDVVKQAQAAIKQEEQTYKNPLLEFVKSGKGLAGAHAATDCYYGWPEYGEMIGGYFSGHPYSKHVAKIDDPASPLTAAFGGKPFPYSDEMYCFAPKGKTKDGKEVQPYSREKVRVLLSIDVPATKEKDPKWNEKVGGREDADYAISWVRSYGDGRVFYCSYGHNDFTWWNPTILKHFLDGIQFALGDLKADTTPVPLKK